VRLELLEKAPKTASDLECPHGVQFYDVVIMARATPAPPGVTRRRAPRCNTSLIDSASGTRSRSADHRSENQIVMAELVPAIHDCRVIPAKAGIQ
jgi:hypothetical protein